MGTTGSQAPDFQSEEGPVHTRVPVHMGAHPCACAGCKQTGTRLIHPLLCPLSPGKKGQQLRASA
jgi:hypothetical protein